MSTGIIDATCLRAATSGTMPPYLRCMRVDEAMTLVKIFNSTCLPADRSSTTAAAVSSHDDSIPKIFICFIIPPLRIRGGEEGLRTLEFPLHNSP